MIEQVDPLAGVPAVDHSDDLPALRRLLDVPQAKAEYLRTVGRFDGINHWGDLLECQVLLEQIAWEREQRKKLQEQIQRLQIVIVRNYERTVAFAASEHAVREGVLREGDCNV